MINRGEIYAASERGVLTRKPRPVLIIQNDRANETHSTINVCLFSTSLSGLNQFRISIAPSPENGLAEFSEVQVDRIFSYRAESLQDRIGQLSHDNMRQIDTALRRWLDL